MMKTTYSSGLFSILRPLLICLLLSPGAYAGNIVTVAVLDSAAVSTDKLEMTVTEVSNYGDKTTIMFEIESANTPFTIYNAVWRNAGGVHKSLEPFSLTARPEEAAGKNGCLEG